MADSDQIKKLRERNERLQKQLDGSKKKVSDLQDKLKHTRAPPPLPKDSTEDKDPGQLEKKVEELTGKLEKLNKELQAARGERDDFAQQLRTLREKLIAGGAAAPGDKEDEEPEYDPETKKYKLSWVGDALKEPGKKKAEPKGPPTVNKKDPSGLDKRTTEEKMSAMAAEKQALEKKPREKPKPEEKKEKEKEEEELEETESYSVEELLEKAEKTEDAIDFNTLKDMKDGASPPSDGPTVPGVALDEVSSEKLKKRDPDDSDVAVVTSESGGRPVLRMHEVPDDEVAEPTFKEEESLVTESREEVITDKRTDEEVKEAFIDDDSDIMTEEKPMVHVPPPPPAEHSESLFSKIKGLISEHRALILKSLLFLAGAGLGVGLALLIFLGPDSNEPGAEEGARDDKKAVEKPAETPKKDVPKKKKVAATKADTKPRPEKAPAELVEPIYKDAAIMDKKEAAKIGAALKVFVDKYPKDPLLRYHYARSLYHKGEVQAAIAQLEETMKLDPDMPEVHYMLGGIYLRMGDEKKAHEALNNFTRLTGKSGK
jgi:tetratricopeptide (TPR) repeat protein